MKNFLTSIAGVTALCMTLTWPAKAACGSSGRSLVRQGAIPAAGLSMLALQLAQKGLDPAQADADKDTGDGNAAAVVGFWKTTFTSDAGVIVDVGFDQFHPDGMENALDSPAPSAGNVCFGVWENISPRHLKVVHPAFNWDATTGNVVSIFVERLDIKVSRDGTLFSGTFTWDSYDFKGNVLGAQHVEGTITGERITVNGRLPFPFPF